MTKNPIPQLLPLSTLSCPPNEEFMKKYFPPCSCTAGGTRGESANNLKKSALESTAPTSSLLNAAVSKAPSTATLRDPIRPLSGATAVTLRTNNYILTGQNAKKIIAKEAKMSQRKGSTKIIQSRPSGELGAKPGMTLTKPLHVVSQASLTCATVRPFSSQLQAKPQDPGFVSIEYYLDYTDKYGVGYVLTNGFVGFFFNDMTNMLWIQQKSQYAYCDYYKHSATEEVKYYSTKDFPGELNKKVKIMAHFHTYYDRIKEENQLQGTLQNFPDLSANNGAYVAIKRFVKTRNGLFMRLTNGVLQMFFTDKTQIVINFKKNILIFVEKKGSKEFIKISSDRVINANERIVKRYSYALSIVNLLSSGKVPGPTSCKGRQTLKTPLDFC